MNAEEGTSLAKMGVTVLLVVLVIGAIVALVYKAYSWFNSGSDKLGDQVNSITSSSYSQFDDVQVTGTDVLTALKQYRDADIAIAIANKNNNGDFYNPSTPAKPDEAYVYCALPDGSAAATAFTGINYYEADDTSTGMPGKFTISSIAQTSGNDQGKVLHNTNFSPTTDKGSSDTFVKTSATWYANLVYDESTGDVCGILFQQMN